MKNGYILGISHAMAKDVDVVGQMITVVVDCIAIQVGVVVIREMAYVIEIGVILAVPKGPIAC